MDLTGSLHLHGGDAMLVAREVSERVKAELGCTVSVGVSWNKVFAKFGSDYEKPDAITAVTRGNYRELVWGPVRDLLYVGPATERAVRASASPEIIEEYTEIVEEVIRKGYGRFIAEGIDDGERAAAGELYTDALKIAAEHIHDDEREFSMAIAIMLSHDVAFPETERKKKAAFKAFGAMRAVTGSVRDECLDKGIRDGGHILGFCKQHVEPPFSM